MYHKSTILRHTVLLFLIAFSLSGCESVGNTYSSLKNRVASVEFGMPDFLSLDRDDERDEKKTARALPPELSDEPANRDAQVASSAIVEDAEAAYNADLAALGLASNEDNMPEVPEGESDTYVFRDDYDCPSVSLVRELKSLHQFQNPSMPDNNEKVSSIEFTNVKSNCQIKEGVLVVDVELGVKGGLGPNGRQVEGERPVFSYPYFLAVTSPKGNILAKDIYAFTASYGPAKNVYYGQDTIRQIMPMPESGNPQDRTILIGFQLSPEELAYNRSMSDPDVTGFNYAAEQDGTPNIPPIEPAAGQENQEPVSKGSVDLTSKN